MSERVMTNSPLPFRATLLALLEELMTFRTTTATRKNIPLPESPKERLRESSPPQEGPVETEPGECEQL